MKLSENLKNIRKENNLSQEQLAEKLGVSRQAVSKWESGQSYPEMDKVLLICKLFNYNMDELMNENIKEVEENKQSKNNINKYIDDFFGFITKTVDMITSMSFKQKMKCLAEEAITAIVLLCIFGIIGGICSGILSNIFYGINSTAYRIIGNILETIYGVAALVIGITIFLHIFKIRYLDYYEFVREDKKTEEIEKKPEQEKIVVEKKQEKIVIRDPEDSQSNFLTGIFKIILIWIKIFVAFFGFFGVFTFIGLIVLFILSFMFAKTGLMFCGAILGILAGLIINFIFLEIVFNFIVNRKCKKTRIGIMLIVALILAGVGIGIGFMGVTEFKYNPKIENEVVQNYEFEMTDNLSINKWGEYIEYITEEDNTNRIRIELKSSEYTNAKITQRNETIYVHYEQNPGNAIEILKQVMKDINNKEIRDYYFPRVIVYGSKENIDKLQENREKKYNQSLEIELQELREENYELKRENRKLRNQVYEVDD